MVFFAPRTCFRLTIDPGLDMAPSSLPALRSLVLQFYASPETPVVGALLAAAGPHLTSVSTTKCRISAMILRALAERDLLFLPRLKDLQLTWSDLEVYVRDEEPASLVAAALARTHGLTTIALAGFHDVEELFVRLLVLM